MILVQRRARLGNSSTTSGSSDPEGRQALIIIVMCLNSCHLQVPAILTIDINSSFVPTCYHFNVAVFVTSSLALVITSSLAFVITPSVSLVTT